jgi:thiosulfate sulfurtransferase
MNQFVTVSELLQQMRLANPPALLDVRKRPAYESDQQQIAGAVWRDPEQVAAWAPSLTKEQPVVVYCIKGQEVGKDCAAALQEQGIDARYLEGGIEAFKRAGGMLVQKS